MIDQKKVENKIVSPQFTLLHTLIVCRDLLIFHGLGIKPKALFAWLISRTFSTNEQYFSLTTNQPTVLSVMAYQPSEQGDLSAMANSTFLQQH